MNIDLLSFTPWTALAGGVMLGVAAAMLVLINGRLAGITTIVAGLMRPDWPELPWRLAFVAGLIVAPSVYGAFVYLPAVKVDAGYATLIAAGLLVGAGSRYAGGCTSGHGVCGLSRLSLRSLIAMLLLMAGGVATVYVMFHLISAA